MNSLPNRASGYLKRDEIFIDSAMLGFIEQQVSLHPNLAEADILEVLAILVEEFGPRYRRLNPSVVELGCEAHLRRCQQSLNAAATIDISRGNSKAVLDQHACSVPCCIIEVLLTTLAAHQQAWTLSLTTTKAAEAVLMEALFKRAQQLMAFDGDAIEVLPPLDNVACIAQARQRAAFSALPFVSHA